MDGVVRVEVAGRKLGELEIEIMRQLWAVSQPLTAQEVAARLPGAERAPTTVLTVLARLSDKALVERVNDGRRNLYRAAGDADQLTAQAIDRLLAAATDRRAVLAHLLHDRADPRLVQELAAILAAATPPS